MDDILKWLVPINVLEVRSIVVVTEYLRKFITSFLVIATPFHNITTSRKSFLWGKGQQKAFEELRRKIS